MLTFQSLLRDAGIDLGDVRLLRHAKGQGTRGIPPYVAWRDDRDLFHQYQSTQPASKRRFFSAPYWASFVGLPRSKTLFVGVYAINLAEAEIDAFDCPLTGKHNPAGRVDLYRTEPATEFLPYSERLFIEWGASNVSWRQYADRHNKPIARLLGVAEEPEAPYPGHSALISQLSDVPLMPSSWKAVLGSAQGVYLLSSARDRQQYVGSACGAGGFFTRWLQHANREGDAAAFRLRDPENYLVSILEVAGSLATSDDILKMEQRWKDKLQSREMGLNKN